MKKIKVASLFLSMEIGKSGGAGKVHATLGKIINHNDIEFVYLQLEDKEPRYEHEGEIINLHEKFYMGFGLKKIFSLIKLAYHMKKICAKNHIDILLGQGDFFFMVTGLSKILGNKSHCIGIVHTTLRMWPKLLQIILVWFLKKNNTVVCISKEEKLYLSEHYTIKDQNISLLYNSIDIEYLEQAIQKPILVKDNVFFQSKKFTYLSVGRFSYQKNFQLLIDAFCVVYQKNQDIQLIIIGDGEEYEKLIQYVESINMKNSIHLIGRRTNPMSYMKYANCFVMSSRYEGYPMVLLEACVGGLPIVTLNCPTGPSEVLGYNEGGILKHYTGNYSKDMNSLASGLIEIHKKNLNLLGKRNKQFVQQYDNKIIGEERNKLFYSIIINQK